MKVEVTEMPHAEEVDENGRESEYHQISIDLYMDNDEIDQLTENLHELKKEDDKLTGFHFHLWDLEDRGSPRYEATFMHASHYGKQIWREL